MEKGKQGKTMQTATLDTNEFKGLEVVPIGRTNNRVPNYVVGGVDADDNEIARKAFASRDDSTADYRAYRITSTDPMFKNATKRVLCRLPKNEREKEKSN